MEGTVIRLESSRGFAILKGNEDIEYFCHFTSFNDREEFKVLELGHTVEFEMASGRDGKSAAKNSKIKGLDRTITIEPLNIKNEELKRYLIDNALTAPSNPEGYDDFCDKAKEYATILKDGRVGTSMIRKIYSRILAADNVMELKILRPQFAYTAGRNSWNNELKEFMEILDTIVRSMKIDNNEEEFKNFKQFMEAIVAYRRYVGDDRD